MIKKIILSLVLLIVIALGGLYMLRMNLDGIVKASIEKYGSEATQASAKLDNIHIALREGAATLQGFTLGNPAGFTTPTSIALGKVDVQIDAKSAMESGPILIKKIIIDAPEITYEVKKDGSSNLQKIQSNVQNFASSFGQKGSTGSKEPAPTADKGERKIIIEQLVISNGSVKLAHELLADKNAITAKLPTLQMNNIGKESAGVTAADFAQLLLQKLTTQAIAVGQSNLVKELGNQGIESLKGAVGQTEIGKTITNILGQ